MSAHHHLDTHEVVPNMSLIDMSSLSILGKKGNRFTCKSAKVTDPSLVSRASYVPIAVNEKKRKKERERAGGGGEGEND